MLPCRHSVASGSPCGRHWASTERTSITAPRFVGGLQLASIVECVTGAAASELMFLFNGCTLASDIARDSRQDAMHADPNLTYFTHGLVPKATAFLAGYGIYVTIATDKLVGRMFDNYAPKKKIRGHPLVGPFSSYAYTRSQKCCRVGPVAHTIRSAIKKLRSTGIHPNHWKLPRAWWHALPENSFVSAHTCAVLYSLANMDTRRD